ncbi:dephospho-CoA kinase [Glaciecola sp. MH2013]|uniref:dephospho-CoA kinase n=1 Tax=Glaciecola sp. MH2013 TaxID=2785524 RepID=UPI00189D276F|nr:dephospho-CoA kinase [Glaciecola sp. MH2013]MBF7072060.1 dephospho-CoA kinase [Glaciecola sp. MH2013]
MSTYIVGLTGGIASGKTTVSDHFIHLGIDVIDADIIAREVVEPSTEGFEAIVGRFGSTMLCSDGFLDRAKLRAKVFSDEGDKQWLNALLHPLIRNEMLQQTQQAQSPYCILSVPLLIENGLNTMVNRTLVVDIDEDTQLKRALNRDGSSISTIKSIMAAQASRQTRIEKADDLIRNTKDISYLHAQTEKLHHFYLRQSQ